MLGAIEGLKVARPLFEPCVVPVGAVILIAVFAIQRHGTHRVSRDLAHEPSRGPSLPSPAIFRQVPKAQ